MERLAMRQAVMTEPGKIIFHDIPTPEIGANDILMKVMRIGVCGSDIHVFKGKHPYVSYPLIQGHEVSGIIERVGSGVDNFTAGEKITVEPQVSCGTCYPCTHGRPNVCTALKVLGFQTTGTASDYFVIPADKAVKIPDGIGFDEAAMVEPTAVGVGAAAKIRESLRNEVLVFGAGPVGNLTAQVFKGLGAEKTAIADINDLRLAKASECGIAPTFNTKDPEFRDRISAEFGTAGPTIVVDCAGANATMDLGIDICRHGGILLVIGVFPGKVSIDINQAQEKELTIIGTARYIIDDFRTAIDLISEGKVNLEPLITHHFQFEKYLDAYKQIENHGEETMKVIVQVND